MTKPEKPEPEKSGEVLDPLAMTERLVRNGFAKAEAYYNNPDTKLHQEFTREWLAALECYTRLRAIRTKESANLLELAKVTGIRGQALASLWSMVTGQPFPGSPWATPDPKLPPPNPSLAPPNGEDSKAHLTG